MSTSHDDLAHEQHDEQGPSDGLGPVGGPARVRACARVLVMAGYSVAAVGLASAAPGPNTWPTISV